MGVEDTWGKLQKHGKIGNLEGSSIWLKQALDKISFKSIFYHLVCYLHWVDKVLANEFNEI